MHRGWLSEWLRQLQPAHKLPPVSRRTSALQKLALIHRQLYALPCRARCYSTAAITHTLHIRIPLCSGRCHHTCQPHTLSGDAHGCPPVREYISDGSIIDKFTLPHCAAYGNRVCSTRRADVPGIRDHLSSSPDPAGSSSGRELERGGASGDRRGQQRAARGGATSPTHQVRMPRGRRPRLRLFLEVLEGSPAFSKTQKALGQAPQWHKL